MCLSFRTLSGWTLQTFQFQNVVLKCTVAYESVSRLLIDLGKGKSVDFCGVGCRRWDELLTSQTAMSSSSINKYLGQKSLTTS